MQFQSSPARGGGYNLKPSFKHFVDAFVSILTRLWRRVQRYKRPQDARASYTFQSSPARGGGCNTKSHGTRTSRSAFQSSPARGGGCNEGLVVVADGVVAVSILTRPWGRVQRRVVGGVFLADVGVSILTRPWGRVQRSDCLVVCCAIQVSILTRPWGRVQLTRPSVAVSRSPRFNPHPPVGAGATRPSSPRGYARRVGFNPHPPVGAGATCG